MTSISVDSIADAGRGVRYLQSTFVTIRAGSAVAAVATLLGAFVVMSYPVTAALILFLMVAAMVFTATAAAAQLGIRRLQLGEPEASRAAWWLTVLVSAALAAGSVYGRWMYLDATEGGVGRHIHAVMAVPRLAEDWAALRHYVEVIWLPVSSCILIVVGFRAFRAIRQVQPLFANRITGSAVRYLQQTARAEERESLPVRRLSAMTVRAAGGVMLAMALTSLFAFALVAPFLAAPSTELAIWTFLPPVEGLGPIAFALFGYAGYLALRLATRMRAIGAERLLTADGRKPVLFLRSFAVEDLRLDRTVDATSLLTMLTSLRSQTLEESLVSCATTVGPVVAIGRPGESIPPLGAARLYVGDDGDWQAKVRSWISESSVILSVLGRTEGLHWEYGALREAAALARTVLIVPPLRREIINDAMAAATAVLGPLPSTHRREPWPLAIAAPSTDRTTVIWSTRRDQFAYSAATLVGIALALNGMAHAQLPSELEVEDPPKMRPRRIDGNR